MENLHVIKVPQVTALGQIVFSRVSSACLDTLKKKTGLRAKCWHPNEAPDDR